MPIPGKSSRLSIDNYFHFFGRSVYLSGNNGLQVIVKGWTPRRLSGVVTNAPVYLDCDSFDEACELFCNLCKELMANVKSGFKRC